MARNRRATGTGPVADFVSRDLSPWLINTSDRCGNSGKMINSYKCIKEKEVISMEKWDIYDVNKQLTGRTMDRNDWHMQPGDYHLTVLGVIRRPDGRFLITQRVATKAWAALWWEVSGGGAQSGETSYQAVQREVFEETGIDVTGAKGGYQFSYRRDNPDEGDNYFVDIYRFDMDVDESDVKIQEAEAAGFRFATLDEIKELANQGIFLHYDSIKEVFTMK